MMNAEELIYDWFTKEQRTLPWRNTKDSYRIWISEIMLQQTRVETVKDYYLRFMEKYPNVEALATAPLDEVLKLWEGLGYYSRAKNMHRCAKAIQKLGAFPKTYEEWLSLPGIGVYTASAIVSNAFDVRVAAVDGNVLRVYSRFMGLEDDIALEKTKKKYKAFIEEQLLKDKAPGIMNQALMELGATICLPKNPKCDKCPWNFLCIAHQKGLEKVLPIKNKKVMQKREEKTALFYMYQDKLMLLKKEEGLLSGFYGPILLEKWLTLVDVENECIDKNIRATIISLKEVQHIFTHRIWDMKGYLIQLKEPYKREDMNYYSMREIVEDVAVPSAYKKFILEIKKILNL